MSDDTYTHLVIFARAHFALQGLQLANNGEVRNKGGALVSIVDMNSLRYEPKTRTMGYKYCPTQPINYIDITIKVENT